MARRYTDDEARAILRRATDAREAPALTGAVDGHSLLELEEAAVLAGIDRGAVRAAALSTLPTAATSFGARLVGGAARRRHRLTVPGHLPPDRREEVRLALQRVLERDVSMEDAGGYVVWEEDHKQGWTRISVVEVVQGLEMVVEADRRGWVALAWVGSAAVVGGLVPFLWRFFVTSVDAPLLFGAATVALVVGGVRVVWGPAARKLHRTLERAVAEIVARVEPVER